MSFKKRRLIALNSQVGRRLPFNTRTLNRAPEPEQKEDQSAR